jgi:hypothetical protein
MQGWGTGGALYIYSLFLTCQGGIRQNPNQCVEINPAFQTATGHRPVHRMNPHQYARVREQHLGTATPVQRRNCRELLCPSAPVYEYAAVVKVLPVNIAAVGKRSIAITRGKRRGQEARSLKIPCWLRIKHRIDMAALPFPEHRRRYIVHSQQEV